MSSGYHECVVPTPGIGDGMQASAFAPGLEPVGAGRIAVNSRICCEAPIQLAG